MAGLEAARRARAAVEQVRALLTDPTPEGLEQSAGQLKTAIQALESLQAGILSGERPATAAIRTEMSALRRELTIASRLLAHAAALHSAWGRLLALDDEPAAPAGPRLVAHG
jgi:hypothetical protein